MSENRRSKVLINPGFQIKILTYVTILNIFVLAVFEAIHVFYFSHLKELARQVGLPPDHIFFTFLESIRSELAIVFLMACLFMIVVVYGLGFYISNRIAGPIYNVTRSIEKIERGEKVEEIRFRKHDFFPELASALNRLIQHYRNDSTR